MTTRRGFTLLELSIVLVIIGLIIGGITVGQELIASAEKQSIIKKLTSYEVAFNSFRLKYNATPGDMDNAEDYWGAANTDNGDGDGKIDTEAEAIDAWNHLSSADLVSGDYSAAATTFNTGTNIPDETNYAYGYMMGNLTEILAEDGMGASTAWHNEMRGVSITSLPATGGDANSFDGLATDDRDDAIGTGILDEEVLQIDQKVDDGSPVSGKLYAPLCTTDGFDNDMEVETLPYMRANYPTTYLLTVPAGMTLHCLFSYRIQ